MRFFINLVIILVLCFVPLQVSKAQQTVHRAADQAAAGKVLTDPTKKQQALWALFNLNLIGTTSLDIESIDVAIAISQLRRIFNVEFQNPTAQLLGELTEEMYDFLKPYSIQPKGWSWIAMTVAIHNDQVLWITGAESRSKAHLALIEYCKQQFGDVGSYYCKDNMKTAYASPQRKGWIAAMRCRNESSQMVTVINEGYSAKAVMNGSHEWLTSCKPVAVVSATGERYK